MEGWTRRQLAQLASRISDGSHNPPKGVELSEFMMLSSKNVFDDRLSFDAPRFLSAADFQAENRRTSVKAGDVLLTIVGTIGRTAVVPVDAPAFTLQRSVAVIRPDVTLVEARFLMYALINRSEELNAQARGVAQKGIYLEALRDFPIDCPPLPEQRRIVAILDEAFEAIATAKANTEKNLQNAREVFESYLADVFSTRNDGWMDRPLHSLCERITVGHVGSMAKLYKPTGIPFLRSQNIRPFSVSMQNLVFIDEQFHASLGKSSLQAGDVAIVRTGYPGTAAVIPHSLGVANCSDLVIVRPGPEIDAHFLCAFFNSAFGKSMVSGKVVGAAQKHFNVGAAKDVVLHLPPLAEQVAVVAAADELRDQTDILESLCVQKLAALDELKRSLLHQAFTGQLTARSIDKQLEAVA